METELTAKFELIDEMSDKISDVAESGESLADALEDVGERAGTTFDSIADSTATVATSVDGVATSFNEAARETDYWTDAVGDYNKDALEMIYSLDELVEMGYKSADALKDQEDAFDLCDRMATMLNQSMEGSVEIQGELARATESTSSIMQELNDCEEASIETRQEMQEATKNAADAMVELAEAHKAAEDAMAAYDEVMMSGTTDLDELERAAESACMAAERMQDANQKAADATEQLGKAASDAQKELDDMGKQADDAGSKGVDMVSGFASALAAAGITKMIKEITDSVYAMAEAFSNAESIIVDATGATGEALASLEESMMASYSNNYNDLNTVASAIGEINTRMGLTGEELSEVTDLFLDFSNITGTNVVTSVQDATKIMNKYGLEASDLEGVLDQLAYAGQISGASVSNLASTLVTGAATFQNAGFTVENAISLLADFELAGINSSTAITALRTAVNNFTADGEDAQEGLQRIVSEIAEMEDQADATALATQTFGSRAGQELALAIQNGTLSVESFSATLEEADGTIATTAEASKTLADQWQEANNKMTTALTEALQPTIDAVSSSLASLVSGIGDFLIEHPKVTQAISAVVAVLGVAVVAIAGVSAAAAAATLATTAFGMAFSAAIAPITAVAAVVAALAVGVIALTAVFGAQADETEGMTAVTRAQYYELQDLNDEYERAASEYGENSEEALRLQYQIDDLTAAFEENRQTVEEFVNEVDNLCDSVANIASAYQEANATIDSNEHSTMTLLQKYEDLAKQTDLTDVEEKELEAVTTSLSKAYPDLIAELDSAGASAEEYAEAIRAACEAEAEEAKNQQALETYADALQAQADLEEEIAIAEANRDAELERMNDMSLWTHMWTRGEWDDYEAYCDALDELYLAQMQNDALMESIKQDWADIAEAEAAAADEALSMQDAMDLAYAAVQSDVEALCAAYDEAYESALASFEGQFGLFDEAAANMDASVSAAQAAMDSQLAYWDSYLANIETLSAISAEDLGVTQEAYESLMTYVQDGSETAAGLAASMVSAIDQGNTEAITNLANTMEEVAARQEEAAAVTAEWQTNFSEEMDDYAEEMADIIVNDLDLSDEAAESATKTIEAYAQSIIDGGESAVGAAETIARQVSDALAGANTEVTVTGTSGFAAGTYARGTTHSRSNFIAGEQGHELIALPAHAAGTTEGENFYMAGENGPELIVGQPGSEVFPTRETDRLIASLNSEPQAERTGSNEKHIVLEIEGGGSIDIGAGTDTDTVLELIQDNIKPVLLSILKQEIYEEGDLSYEY